MTPTDAFYKAKKTLLLFVGALFLAIFAGFKIVNGEQRVTLLPFQLERPELLATILAVAVVFYLYQLSLQWAAQPAEVQINKFHRLDFISILTLGGISVLTCIGLLTLPSLTNLTQTSSGIFGSIVGVIVAGVATFTASKSQAGYMTKFGTWLRGQAASEEQRLFNAAVTGDWVLNYNPANPRGKKIITFHQDGSIGKGRNNNETNWRLRSGLLEILNSDAKVFSRFFYHPDQEKFVHTNDADTLSIKSQEITRSKDKK